MKTSQIDNFTTEKANLQVDVPKQLKRDVKALGAKQGKSLSEIVTEILQSALEQQSKQHAGAGQ